MADLKVAIPRLRESVAAILRLRMTTPQTVTGGGVQPAQFECGWGSAFCVVTDRYLVTAFHVLNGGQPRSPDARFYALIVPGNGEPFFTFPVVGFPVERQDFDMAVLEIGPCSAAGIHLPAVPVSFSHQLDGTEALTMGFPAPEIVGLNADPEGNFLGGQFFLKSHANAGIVAALTVIVAVGLNLAFVQLTDCHKPEHYVVSSVRGRVVGTAYSEAKTSVDYLALRVCTLDLKSAAALVQRAHVKKHEAELYPELRVHLKRRGIAQTPEQWGDALYSRLFTVRTLLEAHADDWDSLGMAQRLDLVRSVLPSRPPEALVAGAVSAAEAAAGELAELPCQLSLLVRGRPVEAQSVSQSA